ncbi:hypothetical protein F511_16993, partial [Dorcoceras hygrometricum]
RIPRNTLKRTIHKLVATQKKELIKEFASLDNKVSLCSDIWSDHWQSCSYMGITCHWIDNAWNIQKRLLAYRCFNDPHTAQNISHLMFIILEEYGLTSKTTRPPLSSRPLSRPRRRPAAAYVDRTCSDQLDEEFPSVLNSSVLLVQADEGVLNPVVDLIDDLPSPTV